MINRHKFGFAMFLKIRLGLLLLILKCAGRANETGSSVLSALLERCPIGRIHNPFGTAR